MTTRLARRIQTLAAVEISLVLVTVLIAGALLAFGFYIRTLSNELSGTLTQLKASLAHEPLPNARAAGAFAASLLLGTGSEIVFLDADTRVTVYRRHRIDARPEVTVRVRGDLSGDPRPVGPTARVVLGLATAFGLQPLYDRAGNVYIIVRSNDATLVSTVSTFFIPLLVALLVAIACGILIARVLTGQALRPLDDVTSALRRFASGDLTPQLDCRRRTARTRLAGGRVQRRDRADGTGL